MAENWPTIEEDSGEYKFNETVVKNAIKDLEKQLKTLTDTDEPSTIEWRGGVEALAPSATIAAGPDDATGFPAGRLAQQTMVKCTTEFVTAYREFMTAYDAVVTSLYSNAGIEKQADSDSTVGA